MRTDAAVRCSPSPRAPPPSNCPAARPRPSTSRRCSCQGAEAGQGAAACQTHNRTTIRGLCHGRAPCNHVDHTGGGAHRASRKETDMNTLLPHHDGSPLYVSDSAPELGDVVAVRLRVPAGYGPLEAVRTRSNPDHEPEWTQAHRIGSADGWDWWEAPITVRNRRH